MATRLEYGVFLRRDVVAMLKKEKFICSLMEDDQILRCSKFADDGSFLYLEIVEWEMPSERKRPIIARIMIPHSYVLYVVVGGEEISPGFLVRRATEHKTMKATR